MVRLVSPWPWVAHPVSCLILATVRPIQTRFRYGFGCHSLNLATKINSQAHSPKGTPSGIAARIRLSPAHRPAISPSTACKLTVSGSISLPLSGCFSPFPHGTCTLSVTKEYLALEDGSSGFPQTSTYSVVLGNARQRAIILSLTGFSPSMIRCYKRFSYRSGFLLSVLYAIRTASVPQHP